MSDITLSDGREITFDLTKMSVREYQQIFDSKKSNTFELENSIIPKVSGLSEEEYLGLNLLDGKRVRKGFIKKITEPLADPS